MTKDTKIVLMMMMIDDDDDDKQIISREMTIKYDVTYIFDDGVYLKKPHSYNKCNCYGHWPSSVY